MITDVDMANFALDQLGARRITSLDDTTLEAELSAQWLPMVRDTILEQGQLDFANQNRVYSHGPAVTQELPRTVPDADWSSNTVGGTFVTTGASEWGYTYSFHLDDDVLSVNVCRDEDTTSNDRVRFDWEQDGRYLRANFMPVYANCAIQITDYSIFPTLVRDAIVFGLARDVCLALTKNERLHRTLTSEAERRKGQAIGYGDGTSKQQNTHPRRGHLTSVRWGSGGTGRRTRL